jgi:hypothetical protein
MTTTPDAATIAASIDLTTVEGWNLRALLLRFADGDYALARSLWQTEALAAVEARRLGLAVIAVASASWLTLTPLGREVAERLRPRPWFVASTGVERSTYDVESPDRSWCEIGHTIRCDDEADANRIAAALSREDLEAAKRYRTEATP